MKTNENKGVIVHEKENICSRSYNQGLVENFCILVIIFKSIINSLGSLEKMFSKNVGKCSVYFIWKYLRYNLYIIIFQDVFPELVLDLYLSKADLAVLFLVLTI